MIPRSLGLLTVALAVGLASPWLSPETASADGPGADATVQASEHESRMQLQSAVESATQRHIPGAAGSDWSLLRLDESKPRVDGTLRVVATGLMAKGDAPGTQVRLSGIYDPATGRLSRVAYRLQPRDSAPLASVPVPEAEAAAPGWSVQQAVQRALAEAMPGKDVRFALGSAQSLRLEDGGRRFDGVGIGHWDGGDGRFVAFTLALTPDGDLQSFEFGSPAVVESELPAVAGR